MSFPDDVDELDFCERSFCDLFADAIKFALLARKPPECLPADFLARTSLLMTVFAVEGAINGILDETVTGSKHIAKKIERMALLEKAEVIAMLGGKVKEYEVYAPEFLDMAELVDVRNTQAHPKSVHAKIRKNPQGGFEMVNPRKSPRLKITLNHTGWDFAVACTALKIADKFLEDFLLRVCGFNQQQVGFGLLSTCMSQKQNWRFSAMRQDQHPISEWLARYAK